MAKSRRNVVTHGLSGLIGDLLVFRQMAGKTVVSNRPKASGKAPTVGMLKVRKLFRKAAIYATNIIKDLTRKAEYEKAAKNGQSAFNVAFADYLKGPEIEEDLSFANYTGQTGQKLVASIIDNFRVASVNFSIRDAGGDLIESGEAEQSENGLDWVYTTTADNPSYAGGTVTIKAYDQPGNETLAEVMV
ncbi:hypothetical protein Pedsa_3246 [Pseudopedobacter saltans DSM 12145]|uniref:Uncharacterized protein n=1 Tax=Pseudopedobacter saltans (strain ATCC 51119 / DSM 12145 / JCM 21818 / CCUG 39354 / LMG 10337 / NBRC 100064 / NCIMB 13643) TaxID=762903 RepID=F0SBU0_PSESL|nr:hypothetical protein [Pseudopedobacter saltans]ADY53781.1 hypothetical protein Pedsa_3246 [Pseudopedobacter saltans DSM 12145]